MGISGAMFNALSGLTAASRGIEVVSSNVANAQTEGYARRELSLSARQLNDTGSGVGVDGIRRIVDAAVLADLRLADGAAAGDAERLAFRGRVGDLLGQPGQEGSLSDRIAVLQAALVEASNGPDNAARLTGVARAAGQLAAHLRAASEGIQQARMDADAAIASTVAGLNADLARVHDLNVAIGSIASLGRETAALEDQRQRLIDGISAVVPLRELRRDNGRVALVTAGGAVLLDGRPAEIGFAAVGVITPDMTLGSGALAGLRLNGQSLGVAEGARQLGGGRLGALMEIRDGQAVEAQAMIDAVALDLYSRFADPARDPTLAAGQPGLFTDGAGALAPGDAVGLAGRLRLNALVDPEKGGAAWRLRAGIGAALPNDSGDGALLAALADALAAPRLPAGGGFGGGARTAGGLADQAVALWAGGSQALEEDVAFSAGRADTLRALHLQDGVDTDQEMQSLLSLEQAYGANARVISTIDDLMQTLLGL